MARTRKTPQTWITAGLKALTKSGTDGIRAETLARDLGTTKGSFYWHFKDVPDFHAALLTAWFEAAEQKFRNSIETGDGAVSDLRGLASYRPTPLDRAVRAWATHDPRARKSVSKFDAVFVEEVSARLGELDATHPDFPGLILAAVVAAPKSGNHAETLVDLLLMLK